MVWEYNCSCIVLLCDISNNDKVQNKNTLGSVCMHSIIICSSFSIYFQQSSHCFWPEQSGSAGVEVPEEVYGKLKVVLKRLNSHGDIMEWRLEVGEAEGKDTSPHRRVTLLQLTSWSLQELPHPSSILSLVDMLSRAQRSSPSKHTIIMCR